MELLAKFAEDTYYVISQGKTKREQMVTSKEFKRFRSWFKGGQVVAAREEEEAGKRYREVYGNLLFRLICCRNRSNSVSSRGTVQTAHRESPGPEVDRVPQTEAQLVARTALLVSRAAEVDLCVMHATRVVDGHRFALTKGLVESDLMFKRASLSGQVRELPLC